MKWTLTCLTPVHIGTGRELHPMEYVIRNGTYYVLRLDAALELLESLQPGLVDTYAEYSAQVLEQIAAPRKAGEKPAYYAEDVGVVAFCEKKLRRSDWARQLLTNPRVVSYRIEGVAWRPQGRHRQVREQMKIADQPYIPGTSLKGALRSSLAYALLLELPESELEDLLTGFPTPGTSIRSKIDGLKRQYERLIRLLEKGQGAESELDGAAGNLSRERSKLEKEIGEPVDQFLFRCGVRKKGGVSFDEPHMDLLRALQVSDCRLVSGAMTVGEMGAIAARQQTEKPIPIIAEMLDVEAMLECEIRLDGRLLQEMARAAGTPSDEWIGFEEKFTRLFGTRPAELLALKGPDNVRRWEDEALLSLLNKVNRHSLDVLDRDQRWAAKARSLQNSGLPGELKRLVQRVQSGRIVLRLGFASGWHATTVAMALERRNRSDLLADLLYVFLMDLPQNLRGKLRPKQIANPHNQGEALRLLRRTPNPEAFPTSRRLLFEADGRTTPMGWIELAPGEAKVPKNEPRKEQPSRNTTPTVEEISAQDLERLRRRFRGEE